MPRKSTAALTTAKPTPMRRGRRLRASDSVPEAAARIFDEILDTVADDHFKPVDRPLLEQLVVAIHIARELTAEIDREGVVIEGKVSPSVKALKLQQALIGQLASRLRLTTQNRMSKEKAATTANGGQSSISEIYDCARGA